MKKNERPKRMKMMSAHYTNFGVQMQPGVADRDGYIDFRDGFRSLPCDEWTAAEEWVAEMERHIAEFRRRS